MLNTLKGFVDNYNYKYIFTNVYGLTRSLIALGTLITLLFTKTEYLFRESSGGMTYPQCYGLSNLSMYCLGPDNYLYLTIIKHISIFILLLVLIGWRPRITGVLHFWVAFSFSVSATTVDGGEQVAQVITLLLIPITLADGRKWHWSKGGYENTSSYMNGLALASYWAIRFQVAIIYFHAAVAKFVHTWLDGTAVYYYLQNPIFGAPLYINFILKPILESELVVLVTWGTLVVELVLFLGLVSAKKYRKYILLAGISLHAGIAIIIGLYSFSLVMIGSLIMYLRPLEQEFSTANYKRETVIRKLAS